VLPSVNK